MAQPIRPDASQPALPGLDLSRDETPTTALERAALAQLQALDAAGRLTADHQLLVSLILDLARTVGMGARTGKAAGVAMASRQLLDAMKELPSLVPDDTSTEWDQLVAALRGGA